MVSKRNQEILTEILILAISLSVLLVTALGLVLVMGIAGGILTDVYADEILANPEDIVVNQLWALVPFFLVIFHLFIGSYYRFKRHSLRNFEKFMDWISEKTIKDKITDEMVLGFIKHYNVVNHTSEIPLELIKAHFDKYSESDVIDCITNLLSEGWIFEPKVDIFKLIE